MSLKVNHNDSEAGVSNINFHGYIKKIVYSENKVILYNTMNSSLVVLAKDMVENISKIPQREFDTLEEFGFFDTDDLANEKAIGRLRNNPPDMFSVIFEMTPNCNFQCAYCYQSNWDKGKTISYSVLDDSIKYLKKCINERGFKQVGLSFFGGEPLLCKEKIYYVYDEVNHFCQEHQVILSTEITTNAYLLDYEFLSHFDHINVVTTLSMKEDHDKKRMYGGCYGSFDKIVENLMVCNSFFKSGQHSLTIRYNTDYDNIKQFGSFLGFLKKTGIKVSKVTPAYTYEHPYNSYRNFLTFSDFKIWNSTEAVKSLIENDYKVIKVPKMGYAPCAGYDSYSVKVFFDGRLGMCNSSVDERTIRGNISEIADNIDALTTIFPEKKRFFITDSKCLSCKERFLCGGIKFCRQMCMCDYTEIDTEKMLSIYIDYLNQGKGDLFSWPS